MRSLIPSKNSRRLATITCYHLMKFHQNQSHPKRNCLYKIYVLLSMAKLLSILVVCQVSYKQTSIYIYKKLLLFFFSFCLGKYILCGFSRKRQTLCKLCKFQVIIPFFAKYIFWENPYNDCPCIRIFNQILSFLKTFYRTTMSV